MLIFPIAYIYIVSIQNSVISVKVSDISSFILIHPDFLKLSHYNAYCGTNVRIIVDSNSWKGYDSTVGCWKGLSGAARWQQQSIDGRKRINNGLWGDLVNSPYWWGSPETVCCGRDNEALGSKSLKNLLKNNQLSVA
jgi:hypothetical protein